MISSLGLNGWWAKRNTLPMSEDWGETLRDKSGRLPMAKARKRETLGAKHRNNEFRLKN